MTRAVSRNTATGEGVLDALPTPVPNGTVRTRGSVKRAADPSMRNRPVVVKQPGIGWWTCDACGYRDSGGMVLLAHSNKTAHRVFTAVN